MSTSKLRGDAEGDSVLGPRLSYNGDEHRLHLAPCGGASGEFEHQLSGAIRGGVGTDQRQPSVEGGDGPHLVAERGTESILCGACRGVVQSSNPIAVVVHPPPELHGSATRVFSDGGAPVLELREGEALEHESATGVVVGGRELLGGGGARGRGGGERGGRRRLDECTTRNYTSAS